jgi:hypothetical protein
MKRLAIVADDALAISSHSQNRRGRRGTRAIPNIGRACAVRALSRVPRRQELDAGRARRVGPTSTSRTGDEGLG